MNNFNIGVEVYVDDINRKYIINSSVRCGRDAPHVVGFACESILDGSNAVRHYFAQKYGQDVGDEAGILTVLKYRVLDDLIREQCEEYGVEYDPFTKLSYENKFKYDMQMLAA